MRLRSHRGYSTIKPLILQLEVTLEISVTFLISDKETEGPEE